MSTLNRKNDPAEKHSLKTASGIAATLADTEAQLAGLRRQREDIAFQSLITGDDNALVAIDAEIAAVEKQAAKLRDSHKSVLRADEALRQAAKAAQHKSEIRNVEKHLGKRDAAAKLFTKAMAEAIEHWWTMVEEGEQAADSAPALGFPGLANMKTYCNLTQLIEITRKEMARLGGWDGSIGAGEHKSFPGSNPHDFLMTGQPENLPPLMEVIEASTKAIIGTITGKAGIE